jgi:hypothetical protein
MLRWWDVGQVLPFVWLAVAVLGKEGSAIGGAVAQGDNRITHCILL